MNFILSPSLLTRKTSHLASIVNYPLKARHRSILGRPRHLEFCIMQLPYKSKQEYQKHFTAHARRNVGPICEVLCPLLAEKSGKLFEFGSGVGIHIAQLANNLSEWQFQPSDMEAEFVSEIADQTRNLANVHAPITWDVRWKHSKEYKEQYDAALCVNLLHVTGWDTSVGLFQSAGWVLKDQGVLFLYGPFKENGEYNTESNRSFDESLHKKNPQVCLHFIH